MKEETKKLRNVQRILQNAIVEGKNTKECEALVARDVVDATHRLAVYQYAYLARLRDLLAQDFSLLCNFLGQDKFGALIRDYTKAHPSQSFTIADAGKQLANFLQTHSFSKQQPFLGDIARFEFAKLKSFYAPDTVPLEPSVFASFTPEQQLQTVLTLSASIELLVLDYDFLDFTTADPALKTDFVRNTNYVLIWRDKNFCVQAKKISSEEFSVLHKLQSGGATFGETLGSLSESTDLKLLSGWFQFWTVNGLLACR